jgi:hypothetical protein
MSVMRGARMIVAVRFGIRMPVGIVLLPQAGVAVRVESLLVIALSGDARFLVLSMPIVWVSFYVRLVSLVRLCIAYLIAVIFVRCTRRRVFSV